MGALLVPVKSFRSAKVRLSPVLSPSERVTIARELAEGVLDAAGTLDRFVVCDDDEVANWATTRGAGVIWTPGLGLSGAVEAGVGRLGELGFNVVVVAHSDLAFAEGLDELGSARAVTLVPNLTHDGTNVIVVPSGVGYRFSYGPGSFERHRAEAMRLGLPCVVLHDRRLAADIDLPEDLARWRSRSPAVGALAASPA